MNFEFTANGWNEFQYWLDNDQASAGKVRDLLKDISRNPFQGLGKPEPLRSNLKGFRLRRIAGEHRLVYKIEGEKESNLKCIIVQCRFHYD